MLRLGSTNKVADFLRDRLLGRCEDSRGGEIPAKYGDRYGSEFKGALGGIGDGGIGDIFELSECLELIALNPFTFNFSPVFYTNCSSH